MVEFKDVYITAKDGKLQWPILDIERIAFDETSLTGVQFKEAVQMWMNRAPTNGPVWDNLDAALAEKGAEITRLKDYQDVRVTRIIELEDRIAELEKLSTTQKATIDAQGKELHQKQIALANLQDLVNPKRRPCLTCENTECDILIGADQTCWTQAQKKEPELFICPDQGPECICSHNKPHLKQSDCNGFDDCGGKCIPYKEPTAPQPGMLDKEHSVCAYGSTGARDPAGLH